MKTFAFTVGDEAGLHARPAGMLVKKAKEFESVITLEKGGKTVSAKKLMAVMGMGARCGETVTVSVEGADEERAAAELERLIKDNL